MKFTNYFKPHVLRGNDIIELFYRSLAGGIAYFLSRTPITPNQISVSRVLILIGAAFFYYAGILSRHYGFLLCGAFGALLWDVLDHVDGELARLKKMASDYGQWCEVVTDSFVGTTGSFIGLIFALALYKATGTIIPFVLVAVIAYSRYTLEQIRTATIPLIQGKTMTDWAKDKGRFGHGWMLVFYSLYYWEWIYLAVLTIFDPLCQRFLGISSVYLFLILQALIREGIYVVVLFMQWSSWRTYFRSR